MGVICGRVGCDLHIRKLFGECIFIPELLLREGRQLTEDFSARLDLVGRVCWTIPGNIVGYDSCDKRAVEGRGELLLEAGRFMCETQLG